MNTLESVSGWWFQTFSPPFGKIPNLTIFFKGAETTNQVCLASLDVDPIFITWAPLLRKVGSLKMEPKVMLLNLLRGDLSFAWYRCTNLSSLFWRRSLFNQLEMSSHY